MQATQEIEFVAGAKKTYSEIQNVLKLYVAENGGDYTSLFPTTDNSYYTLNKLSKYFNTAKICPSSTHCWEETTKYLNPIGLPDGSISSGEAHYGYAALWASMILSNGSRISISNINYNSGNMCYSEYTTCQRDANGMCLLDGGGNPIMYTGVLKSCGSVMVDVNGAKGPNQFGLDSFLISIYPDKINGCAGSNYGCVETILKTGKITYPD